MSVGAWEPVATAQNCAQLAQQAAERPSALEVLQMKGDGITVSARMHLVCPLMQCRPIARPMAVTHQDISAQV